jgi:hypothetical protein
LYENTNCRSRRWNFGEERHTRPARGRAQFPWNREGMRGVARGLVHCGIGAAVGGAAAQAQHPAQRLQTACAALGKLDAAHAVAFPPSASNAHATRSVADCAF